MKGTSSPKCAAGLRCVPLVVLLNSEMECLDLFQCIRRVCLPTINVASIMCVYHPKINVASPSHFHAQLKQAC